MKKQKKSHKIIATFFLLIFFPTLFPSNLYATNTGPNSFEAATFEPVDSADMVNLATGDMSYVLPLLNVPSPEGGYPLALSYHAGVAMDQEASWVGLGWALNPGAINRGVNGYADDVPNGKEKKFIYDFGGEITDKSISLASNIDGISIGVGFYWGSNKTFGGSVSLGVGPASVSYTNGSYGSDVGVGVGYSDSGNLDQLNNLISTSTSFKTIKSINSGATNSGTGVTSSSISFNKNDYEINDSSKNFSIGLPTISLSFSSRKIKYRLFIESKNDYTGMLTPYGINSSSGIGFAATNDVNKLPMYDKANTSIFDVYDKDSNYLLYNSLLPAKDMYSVNSQGLNGKISPVFTSELTLSRATNVYFEQNNSSEDKINYIGAQSIFPESDFTTQLNNKLFFEFENTNSSFLRIDRSNIVISPSSLTNSELQNKFHGAKTNNSGIYSEALTIDNIPLKNNGRKRTGSFIEVFTNNQILNNGSSLGFIEAKNLNRNQPSTYLPQSIGGYRITDVDGKVYHYSLPVINFEIWNKNYGSTTNEDSNFALNKTSTPYATDWLLTAVTGSDYVDINNNNQVDVEDYGYWVEFDYGKWSDGYIWQTNKDRVKSDDNSGEDRFQYSRGRKQIYYLDAVKTRTHTAYFIKSLRLDSKGKNLSDWSVYAPNGGGFDKQTHTKKITNNNTNYTTIQGQSSFPKLNTAYYGFNYYGNMEGKKANITYADFTSHYSLKLDKVVLVKNGGLIINKASGSVLVNQKKAFLFEDSTFQLTWHGGPYNSSTPSYGTYYSDPNATLKSIDIHLNENIIDKNDIIGLNVNQNAEKVINFGFDENYSLMPNSNNSQAPNNGKLTLKEVDFLGKGGVSYIPKYKFDYSSNLGYNEDLEDGWGFHKNIPTAWCLSRITTPSGSSINMVYQPDDYSNSVAKQSRIFNKGCSFLITKNNTTNDLLFEVTKNTHVNDNVIDEFTNKFSDYYTNGEYLDLDLFICRRSKYGGSDRSVKLDLNGVKCQIFYVDNNTVKFKIQDTNDLWDFDEQDRGWILNRIFSLTSVKHSNGSSDGVIMREHGYRNCPNWRDSYDNDDVSMQYRLTSTKVPSSGKGGGVRVAEVYITDNNVVKNRTKYYYNLPGFGKNTTDSNYKSSGEVSFVPTKELTIIPYASELPPPIVVYKNVTVEECNAMYEVISRTDYNFEAYSGTIAVGSIYDFGDKLSINKAQNESPLVGLNFSKYIIKDKLSKIGALKSINNYNSKNQLLSSKVNTFYPLVDNQGELGVNQESYLSKYYTENDLTANEDYYVNSIAKVNYPNKLLSTTSTLNGHTRTVSFDKFDFLTGQVLETTTKTDDGYEVKSKTVPAYHKYPGISTSPAMGSKVDNINNRNMLSQSAVQYSYIKVGSDYKVTGVGINTWNNEWSYKDIGGYTATPTIEKQKVWRKHKAYIWNGEADANGVFDNYENTNGNDDNFVWTIGVGQPPTSKWKQISEVSLYDHYSNSLENKDINGNFSSMKMGDNQTKMVASGNAGYNELFYSGAESIQGGFWLDSEVRIQNGSRSEANFHTGKYSIQASPSSQFGVVMRDSEHRAGKYKLSVWVHATNEDNARVVTDHSATKVVFNGETYRAGNWVLKTHYFDCLSGEIFIYVTSQSGDVFYDDLMIRPISSSVTGYVYNQWNELSHVISNNGLATRYEYDAGGRLIKTYVEVIEGNGVSLPQSGFKLVKENTFHNRLMQ